MDLSLKSEPPIKVLHLEDNEVDHLLVEGMMLDDGLACKLLAVQSRHDFESALRNGKFDLIISDYTLPSFDGMSGLFIARQLAPRTPFIFFSGTIGEDAAVECLKKGATDYIIKHRPRRLAAAVRNALQMAKEQALLEESRQRNREQATLLDKARDGILVCDLQNRIVYWNQGAERIYGWTSAEAVGRDLTELVFQGNPPKQLVQSLKDINERGEWVGELTEYTKDGTGIVVQIRATLINDDTGCPKSLLLINTDITESKRLEEKFLRAQRMESLGALVSGIAHDLNNALSPVMIGIDILRSKPGADQNILGVMDKSTRRGAEMVKQILAFARGGDTKRAPLNVGQLIKEMARVVEGTFGNDINCRMKLGPELWLVSVIPTQIYQVLMNLCVNAKDAMPEGGDLLLTAENVTLGPEVKARHPGARPGNCVCVTVADTGSGIPPEQLQRIFEPFYTTKPAGKGTGLGLSTAREIIESHGGCMELTSKVGEGTEFRFYLPADVKDDRVPTPPKEAALPSGNGECVLVVDNEAAVVALMRTALENFGYRVKDASNAWEAVAWLDANAEPTHLVIVDLNMPLVGGLMTAIAARRARGSLKLIVTDIREKVIAEKAREPYQPDAFVSKPITMELLLQSVELVLSQEKSA